MEKRIGCLLIDASPPEQHKFKSPLIMIHGLWTGSWCWRQWATHFSNLGWECWAVNLRGRVEEKPGEALKRLSFHNCLDDLGRVIRESPFPPILLAHSLGGLLAQKAAETKKVSALILLASVPPAEIETALPRPLRLFRLKYWPFIFLGRPFCAAPSDLRRTWLASVSEGEQRGILQRMVPESPQLVREFFTRGAGAPGGPQEGRAPSGLFGPGCPTLVVGGTDDRVVPAASLRRLAESLQADFQDYPDHGHWILEEAGGEKIVRDIHRWIILKLGEEILLAPPSGGSN